jgi:hypothetical protein
MIAQNLDDAYRAFNPLEPLSGDLLKTYYVAREPNPIDRIRAILLRTPDVPDKMLFTGHRGCGKSTELNRLLSDPNIQNTFLVVPFSVTDILDPLDLGYVDVLVSIEAALFQAIRRAGVHPGEQLTRLLADFWVPQTSPVGFVPKKDSDPLAMLDGWFEILIGRFGKLRLEATSREWLRTALAGRVSELINHTALLAATLRPGCD